MVGFKGQEVVVGFFKELFEPLVFRPLCRSHRLHQGTFARSCSTYCLSEAQTQRSAARNLRRSIHTDRQTEEGRPSKGLGVIHPLPPSPDSALPTPADIAAEDPPEEEFCHRRQNALHGLGLHQRYLRSSAQKPPEEEEEHGPQSLALTRGRLRFRDCSRDKLQLIVYFMWVCVSVCETDRCKRGGQRLSFAWLCILAALTTGW